jgi:hypothetical protein
MKITDLTNNPTFVDLDLEESANVVGGASYRQLTRDSYLRRLRSRSKNRTSSFSTVETDDTVKPLKPVATGGSVSTNSGKAPIIRGTLYY